ncbi:hypothetical protein D3C74_385710 [compost metagenome]
MNDGRAVLIRNPEGIILRIIRQSFNIKTIRIIAQLLFAFSIIRRLVPALNVAYTRYVGGPADRINAVHLQRNFVQNLDFSCGCLNLVNGRRIVRQREGPPRSVIYLQLAIRSTVRRRIEDIGRITGQMGQGGAYSHLNSRSQIRCLQVIFTG